MRPASLLRNRFGLSLASAAVLCVSLIALFWPVRLDEWDQFGFQISCGDGATADYAQARAADQPVGSVENPPPTAKVAQHVAACQTATWTRRIWTALLAVLGVSGILYALVNRAAESGDGHAGPE